MNIEIDHNVERLIQAGLASGEFHSATEAVAAMARAWLEASTKSGHDRPHLPEKTDIGALALAQAVGPFDPAERHPDFWPQDESIDEFLEFVREIRKDEPARPTRSSWNS
jgi:Arc/MetJ-type ribon-helix-helix transcriptional regulator